MSSLHKLIGPLVSSSSKEISFLPKLGVIYQLECLYRNLLFALVKLFVHFTINILAIVYICFHSYLHNFFIFAYSLIVKLADGSRTLSDPHTENDSEYCKWLKVVGRINKHAILT